MVSVEPCVETSGIPVVFGTVIPISAMTSAASGRISIGSVPAE